MILTDKTWRPKLAVAFLCLVVLSPVSISGQEQPKKEAWYLYKPFGITDIKGKVKSVTVTKSRVVMKFGEPKPGSDKSIEYFEFDSNGQIRLEEGTTYVDWDDSPLNEPIKYRDTYSFDFSKRRIITDSHSEHLSSNKKRNTKTIDQYDEQGSLIESTQYDANGSVTYKSISEKAGNKTYYRSYEEDGRLAYSSITYPNGVGGRISESYKEGKITDVFVTEDLPGGKSQSFSYDGTGTKLKWRSLWTSVPGNPVSTFERYDAGGTLEYRKQIKRTFDQYGNWDTEIELEEVQKFGRTYFEPTSITVRTIKYWMDTQPDKGKQGAGKKKRAPQR